MINEHVYLGPATDDWLSNYDVLKVGAVVQLQKGATLEVRDGDMCKCPREHSFIYLNPEEVVFNYHGKGMDNILWVHSENLIRSIQLLLT